MSVRISISVDIDVTPPITATLANVVPDGALIETVAIRSGTIVVGYRALTGKGHPSLRRSCILAAIDGGESA